MNNFIWNKDTETKKEFIYRIVSHYGVDNLTWKMIQEIINEQTGDQKTPDCYRKVYYKYKSGIENVNSDLPDILLKEKIELLKERNKISDERRQINEYVRKISREETLKEIAIEVSKNINNKKMLPEIINHRNENNSDKEAILELSDIHYGSVVNNYWNKYNPTICKKCFSKLLEEVKTKCIQNNINTIHVVNLGDLINGYIHLGVRLSNRIDIITQTIEISEILSEFLYELSKDFTIHFYSCLDNHSRLDPNKQDSLDLESLGRIIPWYIKERLKKSIIFHENKYDYDIITFNCLGYKIIGVHGHKDKLNTIVEKLSIMTHKYYDIVLTGHLHHFSCDEQNETLVISNGSMIGTDTFAKNLRLSSKASQNLIIMSKKNGTECIYRLVLR